MHCRGCKFSKPFLVCVGAEPLDLIGVNGPPTLCYVALARGINGQPDGCSNQDETRLAICSFLSPILAP